MLRKVSPLLLFLCVLLSSCGNNDPFFLDLLPPTSTARIESALTVPPRATLHLEVTISPSHAGTDTESKISPLLEAWSHTQNEIGGRLLFRHSLSAGSNSATFDLAPLAGQKVLLELIPKGLLPEQVTWRRASIESASQSGPPHVGDASNSERWLVHPPPNSPNIIFYVIDTLRADALGAYGSHFPTPHIDQLAKDGIRFANALTAASWTRPATASLLTGLYPSTHGAEDRPERLPESAFTLAERLRLLGYHTAAVNCNGNLDPEWGFDQGFQFFVRPRVPDRDPQDRPRRNLYADEADAVALSQWKSHLEARTGPIFLYVHTVDPHSPYDPPEWLLDSPRPDVGNTNPILDELNQKRRQPTKALMTALRSLYGGEVAYADQAFGAFLAKLGPPSNTLIVLTADHGEAFQEHGFSSHGMSLYMEELRVPLIFWAPGRLAPATVIDAPVSLTDVLPTVLSFLGHKPAPDSGLPGTNLAALWAGGDSRQTRDRPLMSELDLDGRHWKNLRLGDWDYLLHANSKEEMLFNLARDPLQRRNLLQTAGDTLRAQLRRDLSTLRTAALSEHLEDPVGTVKDPISKESRENLRALGYIK